MVDEEALADGGAGVDVDAGEAVGVFGDDSGNQGHIGQIELVGNAVAGNGEEAGVAEDGLGRARCGRVALIRRDRVEGELASDLGQPAQKISGDSLGAAQTLLRCPVARVACAGKTQTAMDLVDHDQRRAMEGGAEVEPEAVFGDVTIAHIAWEDYRPQEVDHLDHLGARWQRVAGKGFAEWRRQLFALRQKFADHPGQNIIEGAGPVVVRKSFENLHVGHAVLPCGPTAGAAGILPARLNERRSEASVG